MEAAIDSISESSQQQSAAAGGSSSAGSSTVGGSTAEPPAQKPSTDDAEIVCEGDVCYKKSKEPESAEQNETEDEKQEKIKKAMKLIEQKRIERVQEEQRLEKEKEVQRRKEGQDMQNLKQWQHDQEMKQIKEDQLRDKLEAKAARQRVLDQIAEDKRERAQRFSTQASPTEPKPSPVTPPAAPTSSHDAARIQFKKPDGESQIVTFESLMVFADVHEFVKTEILHGSMRDFVLATTFPRREFTQADFDKTLVELNLTPSAVLLIIPKKAPTFSAGPSSVLPTSTDGGLMSMLGALVVGLFSPVVALFAYLKNFVMRSQEPGESANDAGKRKRNEDILAPNDAWVHFQRGQIF